MFYRGRVSKIKRCFLINAKLKIAELNVNLKVILYEAIKLLFDDTTNEIMDDMVNGQYIRFLGIL